MNYFCLMIEGSGSKSLANGSGSGSRRAKNVWIRIRNTVIFSWCAGGGEAVPGWGGHHRLQHRGEPALDSTRSVTTTGISEGPVILRKTFVGQCWPFKLKT
jgi:hypothetical protein